MKRLSARAKWGLGAVLVSALAFGTYLVTYAQPRDELLDRLKQAKSEEQRLVTALKERQSVNKRLSEFGATTLGKKQDVVDKRFRDGLNQIAGQCGLGEVVVSTGAPSPRTNPLTRERGVQSMLKRELQKKPDFDVIEGQLKGAGTLDQVLRALAMTQAQSWVHRVEGFSIEPRGKDRDRFELRVDVSTLSMPDYVTADKDPTVVPAPQTLEAIWSAVAGKNMFREPPPRPNPQPAPPPTVVAVQPPPVASAPPPPPYNDWKLVGVVTSEHGVEAWVVNIKTNERAVLTPGAKVLDLTFVEGSRERAVFEVGGQKFAFVNGQVLGVRTPAEQSPSQ